MKYVKHVRLLDTVCDGELYRIINTVLSHVIWWNKQNNKNLFTVKRLNAAQLKVSCQFWIILINRPLTDYNRLMNK